MAKSQNNAISPNAPRLKQLYWSQVRSEMQKQFNYDNPMSIPRITKIVLNMGIGEAVQDQKKIKTAADDLTLIAGQKCVITKTKKAIASFKVRENLPIGAKVTLRKDRMYEFLDRFVNIAMPRIKDFRGLNPKSFDQKGNFSMGIKEHTVFPEINYDKTDVVWGMDITFVTTARNKEEALFLLKQFNFPFRNSK